MRINPAEPMQAANSPTHFVIWVPPSQRPFTSPATVYEYILILIHIFSNSDVGYIPSHPFTVASLHQPHLGAPPLRQVAPRPPRQGHAEKLTNGSPGTTEP